MDGVGRGRGEGAGGWPLSAALFQVGGQEQPRGQEVQVPVADLHLPLALQVGTCQSGQVGPEGKEGQGWGTQRGRVLGRSCWAGGRCKWARGVWPAGIPRSQDWLPRQLVSFTVPHPVVRWVRADAEARSHFLL